MTTTPWTLADLATALRASWSADTCEPADITGIGWTPGNPAWGQCDITALVVHDLLGGELMVGEVFHEGRQEGYHCWNVLAGGIPVDLTREQFRRGETITRERVVERPADRRPRRWAQYQVLRQRVIERLGPFPGTVGPEGRRVAFADHGGPGEPLLVLGGQVVDPGPEWRVITLADGARAEDVAGVLERLMLGPAVVLAQGSDALAAARSAGELRPELVRAVVEAGAGAGTGAGVPAELSARG
ncbi:hypothetical protein [Streptomyces sp. NPDC090022]|uniref:YunG family protein n=1 Tax=Streptomyces sp. NPDC090022 TaxID=3365920 RepID=UPI003802381A